MGGRSGMQFREAVVALVTLTLLVGGCGLMNALKDRLPAPYRTEDGVTFLFDAPSAKTVNLAGTFNDWGGTLHGPFNPSIDVMRKNETGVWELVVPLKPGKYEYKFVIDGGITWEEDPNNPERVDDGYGGYNSILVVK
jgi:1,4-alpha-glucan branching enzyme